MRGLCHAVSRGQANPCWPVSPLTGGVGVGIIRLCGLTVSPFPPVPPPVPPAVSSPVALIKSLDGCCTCI